MKTKLKYVLGALLVATAAFAVGETVEREVANKPRHFPKGIYLGSDSSRAVADTHNKITHSGAEQLDYLFPAMLNDGGGGNVCILSTNTATVEGAQTNDACMLGFSLAAVPDAGGDSTFNCFVTSAARVGVRRCAPRTAGALPDAGYFVRTFSFIP